ncbi:cytochrome c-type biogenesis CcmF C-terminal domain-containing protein [Promicromonospora iranensis]|uniref:Cytochrome c-type biogenesis protein CcmF n=1 Tax=Promicromonospora iranensis TaxID=1105144 RepID=A0ABU2CI72_9MICO|nr:cytochrome c-type biogenesis CcmF C-terminal domain-containing protein [Promicromonospora iranensis]MDR7381039.1 cytochrome c-type biogenesis protein CcmF [Promicromonospora iranensis]
MTAGLMAGGTVLLVLALTASVTAAVACGAAARTPTARTPGRERFGTWALVGSAAAIVAAVVLLEAALLRQDTTWSYVQRVTDTGMSAYYRVSAMWSALEGSLLLWLAALATVAVVALFTTRRLAPPDRATVLSVLAATIALFCVVSLVASPFTASSGSGGSPSPLLRDHVAMGMHPPLLYGGFAALAVPYALSVAALVRRRLPRGWAATTRAWNVGAWTLLTAGVGLGAWWSYAVLGWGGYWAWDPVENASLLPWLASTALLHAVGPRTRSGRWRTWAVVLSGLGFVLVVLAQLVTRSGIVESVHAFTTSALGPVLVAVLGVVAVPWVILLGRARSPAAPTPLGDAQGGSGVRSGVRNSVRATALDGQRALLIVVLVVVAVGTLLPTALLLLTGERVSVGPPWYQRTLAPFALLLLVLLATAPWLARSRRPPHPLVPGAVGAVVCCVVGLTVRDPVLAVVAGLAAFTVTAGVPVRRGRAGPGPDRHATGSWLAHTGVALGAVAVIAGSHGTVREAVLPVGETLSAGDTTATLVRLDRLDEAGRQVAEAELLVGRDGELVGTARPQLRWYADDAAMLAGPDIRSSFLEDVYVTLLDADPAAGTATVRLAVTPLVGWIWAGVALAVAGGTLAAVPGRRSGGRGRLGAGPRPASGSTAPAHHPLSPRTTARVLTVVVLPMLVLGLAGCASTEEDEPSPAPPLAGEGLDGREYDVAELRGSVVLVTAWASWCAPCRDEMPVLADAQEELGDAGLEVLGINVRDLPEPARQFAAEHEVSFPSIVDQQGTMSVAWGLRGVPVTYLVDREGHLVERHPGPVTATWIDTVVEPEVRG